MVNLFAFRATEPKIMMASVDPVGTDNDTWIKQLASDAGVIIAAWGNDGSFMERSRVVRDMIPGLLCLKINKSGEPAHPLYQPRVATPVRMGKTTR